MLIDGRDVAPGTEIVRDLCIVGAGPAGIAICSRLAGSGISIALLESGGQQPSVANQKLYSGDNIGYPYFRLDGSRFRTLGGSGIVWGGWSRPLDPIDFDKDTVGGGWPISADEVAPYNEDAAKILMLPTADYDMEYWSQQLPPSLSLEGTDFENAIFQFSSVRDFAGQYGSSLADNPDVSLFLNTNVVKLAVDPGTNRIGAVEARPSGQGTFTVRAKIVVLATGGLENPRLLLTSHRDNGVALGNEHDNVGRYFMEHLHVPVGFLATDQTQKLPAFYDRQEVNGAFARGVIIPSENARRRLNLGSCSIAIDDDDHGYNAALGRWAPEVSIPTMRAVRSLTHSPAAKWVAYAKPLMKAPYRFRDVVESRRQARAAARDAATGDGVAPDTLHSIYIRSEQVPNRESRVTLTDKVDALGLRRIQLDWRVTEEDKEIVRRWRAHFAEAAEKLQFGRVVMPEPDWSESIVGGPHHIGTTRMSDDPTTGVVDRDCRVHSLDNLYVTGSSVFSTGGFVNPTYTLLALAVRLGDHLKAALG